MTRHAIVAVLRSHGFFSGRMIAQSKTGYRRALPKHFVIFNAKVFTRRGLVLKSADLDLTLDAEQLTAVARAIGENLFVLYENDPAFFWRPGSTPMSTVLQYAIWWTCIRSEDQDTFIAVDASHPRRPRGKPIACTVGTWQGRPAYSVDCWTNPTCGGCNTSGAVVELRGHPPRNLQVASRDKVISAGMSATRGRATRPMFYHRSGPLEYVWFTHGAALPARLYDCCIRQRASVTFTIHRDTDAIHIRRDGEVIGLIWACGIAAPEVVARARQYLRSVQAADSVKGRK